jgi:hypothetical protein
MESDTPLVMALIFGHLDGEEQAVGNLGVYGTLATPRSRSEGQTQG